MKVLITDDTHELLPKGLADQGLTVSYLPQILSSDILEQAKEVNILVVNSKCKINDAFLSQCKALQLIVRLGSGLDIADLDALERHNVIILNTPEGNAESVAEHCVGMILAFNHKICIANSQIRNQVWSREPNRGNELKGKTIGIVGYGHTGKELARRLSGFGMKILAYDKYKTNISDAYVAESSLNRIQVESDIISLHLALTTESKGMINKAFYENCKQKPLIVNTSRGDIVPTADLLDAYEQGKIEGACLDVFEYEPLGNLEKVDATLYQKMLAQENFILTPHVAGWTFESKERIARIALSKILNFIQHS